MNNSVRNYAEKTFYLKKVTFDFDPDTKYLDIELKRFEDEIQDIKIDKNHVSFLAKRRLLFDPEDAVKIEVTFYAELETKTTLTENDILQDAKNMHPVFNRIFSDISLLISNMTNSSIWGSIITIPGFISN